MANQVFTTDGTFSIIGKKNIAILVDFGASHVAFSFNIDNSTLYGNFTSQGTTDLVVTLSSLPSSLNLLNGNGGGLTLEPDGTQDTNDYGWDVESDTSTASVPTVTFTYDAADAPTFTDPQNFSFPENSLDTVGSLVSSIDSDFSNPTYAITGGAIPDQYDFVVDSSGQIQVDGTPFDFENPVDNNGDNVYTFTVELTDDTGATASGTVNVTITNVGGLPYADWHFDDASGTNAADSSGNGSTLVLSGSPAWGTGTLIFDGTDDRGQVLLNFSGPYGTLAARVKITAYPANQCMIAGFSNNGSDPTSEFSTVLGIDSSGHVVGYVYDGGAKRAVSSTAISLNTWTDIGVTFTDGGEIFPYVAGVQDGEPVPIGSQYNSWSSGPIIKVGGSTGGTGTSAFQNFFHGELDYLKVFNDALDDAEMAALVTSATTYYVAGGTGTYTLSGGAGVFKVTRRVVGGTGTYTLSGGAGVFKVTHRVTGGTGTYTLTGGAAQFQVTRRFTGGTGSYTLTGGPAVFHLAHQLVGGTGVFTLAGTAQFGVTGKFIAQTGVFALSGGPAIFHVVKHIAAGTGTFSLSGGGAEFSFSELPPNPAMSAQPIAVAPLSSIDDDGVRCRMILGIQMSCAGQVVIGGVPQTGTRVDGSVNFDASLTVSVRGSTTIPVHVAPPSVTFNPPSDNGDPQIDDTPGMISILSLGGPLSPTAGITQVASLFAPNRNIVTSDDGPALVLDELTMTFDEGKQLTFHEVNPMSYGLGTYQNEDIIQLQINLGNGAKTYFKGKVKRRSHKGENNEEEIKYTAYGYQQLADEVPIYGLTGEGYQVEDVITVSTLSFNGAIVPAAVLDPKHLQDAVTGLFNFMAPTLQSYDIPSNVDVTGISTLVVVDGSTVVSGNFFQALKTLVSIDPGVKPWFNDTNETWEFVRAIDSNVISLDVGTVPIMAHEYEENTEDRYTAIIIYEDGNPQTAPLPVSTTDLVPGWDRTLESQWTHSAAQATGGALNADLTPIQKVYREWIMTQRIGAIPNGTKAKLHYRLPGFASVSNPYRWGEVAAEIIIPKPDPTAIFIGPGQSPPKPYATLRAVQPIVMAGNPYVTGHGKGPRTNEIAATYFLPSIVGGDNAFRYPVGAGFEGTAYTKLGVKRVKQLAVPQGEVYEQNAEALLRIYKDIIITCNLPIYGDPIELLMRRLEGRISMSHVQNVTGLEDARATVYGYTYNFAESIGTIQITTDMTNFIKKSS